MTYTNMADSASKEIIISGFSQRSLRNPSRSFVNPSTKQEVNRFTTLFFTRIQSTGESAMSVNASSRSIVYLILNDCV